MVNIYEDKDGGMIVVKALTYVGPIRAIKVSSGKGKDLVEKTVYNFMMKGGFQVFQSVDYDSEEDCQEDHGMILSVVAQ